LLLARAAPRLEKRLSELDAAIERGERGDWAEYLQLVLALSLIGPATSPEAGGRLLTTREMAEKLGISTTTLLRRREKGQLRHDAVTLGERGRAAIRWRGNEVG
jgi:predicted DNA-binding transcriptional regulator AlpA